MELILQNVILLQCFSFSKHSHFSSWIWTRDWSNISG